MTDFPNFPFSLRFESREGCLASVTVENATALYNYDTSGLFLNESETPNLGDKGHLTHSDVLGRLDQLDAVHFVYGPNGQITSASSVWPRTLSDARATRLGDGHQRA